MSVCVCVCVCMCVYHGRQRCVQAGFCLAVVCIAVFVAAAVIDEADLQVHSALKPVRIY